MILFEHLRYLKGTIVIYCLADPRTGEFRYVGKSINIRLRVLLHIRERGNTHKIRWLAELASLDLLPVVIILEIDPPDWKSSEIYWIKNLRDFGYQLINETSGGEGVHNPSKSSREKLRKFQKKRWQDTRDECLAVARDPSRCAKISAALKGQPKPWARLVWICQKGWHQKEESKQKISAKMMGNTYAVGNVMQDHVREALRISLLGNQHTRGRLMPEHEKKTRSLSNLGQKRTPEQRTNQSKAATLRWSNVSPDDRRAHLEPALVARLKKGSDDD